MFRRFNERAQSSPLGISLIVGITLVAAVAIVVLGTVALENSQQESSIGQAEQAMTQFDSRTAQVALGDSTSKSIGLGRGDYRVDESAGSVTVYHENWDDDGSTETIFETQPLGAVTYRQDGTIIGYQGGGVWRQDADGDARMVSPPEFHYRDRTLTYPIVRVNGQEARSGSTRAHVLNPDSRDVFPRDETYEGTDIPYANPTDTGSILVEIESQFCTGWESFFESRSEGGIEQPCDEDDEDTVIIDLTVPFQETFENTITYTDPGGLNCNPADNCPDNSQSDRPSVSPAIEEQLSDCEQNNCGTELSGTVVGATLDETTYYADDDLVLEGVTFDTSDNDVRLVVDGDLDLIDENDIEGDGEVQILLNGSYDLSGGDTINKDGSADQLQIYVHSDVDEITHDGDSHLTGVVYAPGTDFVQNGNGIVKGAILAKSVTDNGASSDWEQDESLEDFETDLVAGNPITFLHITENEIEVELR